MAEVEKQDPTQSKELAQQFVQFVMMQVQNTLLILGQLPTPHGQMQPDLETGKMLIDQLTMIETKTQGNLTPPEAKVLKDALKTVNMAFVEVSGGTPASMMPSRTPNMKLPEVEEEEEDEMMDAASSYQEQTASPVAMPSEPAEPPRPAPAPEEAKVEEENKKKFFKSYG